MGGGSSVSDQRFYSKKNDGGSAHHQPSCPVGSFGACLLRHLWCQAHGAQGTEDHRGAVLPEQFGAYPASEMATLSGIAVDCAGDVERRIDRIVGSLQMAVNQMDEIEREPWRFLPQEVSGPSVGDAGKIAFYIQHSPGADLAPLAEEIHLMANVESVLRRAVESNPDISSIFVASAHRYTLSVDDNRNAAPGSFSAPEAVYDAVSSDWYQMAEKKGGVAFTPVRRFAFHDVLGFFCAMPYYDSTGNLAGVAAVQTTVPWLASVLKNTDSDMRGDYFIIDQRGYAILSLDEETGALQSNLSEDIRDREDALGETVRRMVEGETGIAEVDIDGKECFLAYAPIRNMGWSFAVAVEKEAVLQPVKRNHETIRELTAGIAEDLNKHMREMTFVMALSVMALLVLTAYVGRRVSRSLARPVHELVGGVREIAKGNLDVRMDMRTGDEIEELADAVNNMTDDLKAYMRHLATAVAEKERISTELSLARGIQEGMLPHVFPAFPDRKEIDLYASMSPAKEVGGDFYDFYLLDDHRIAITIADVSGKGIGAALFMVIAKTILKNEAVAMERGSAGGEMEWAQVLAETNHQLCESNEEMMFVTVFFGVLNIRTGEFAYVNGGHNAPLLGNMKGDAADWRYIRDGKKSHMVGVVENASYEEKRLRLLPGDMLYFYTDGVTEAMDEERKLYSEERLQAALNRMGTPTVSSKELLESIRKDISLHVGGAEQSDDITMLGIRYLK